MRRWPPRGKVAWSWVSFGKSSLGFLNKHAVGRCAHADDGRVAHGDERQAPVEPQGGNRIRARLARLPRQVPKASGQRERTEALRNGGAQFGRSGPANEIEEERDHGRGKPGRRYKERAAGKCGPVGV